MVPVPAASISGRTARVRRMGPVRLTLNTLSQVASSTSAGGRKSVHDPGDVGQPVHPALGRSHNRSGGVRRGDVSGDRDDVEITQFGSKTASRCSTTSVAMTLAPSCARRVAVASPIPEPAPVTMTVFPAKRDGYAAGCMAYSSAYGPRQGRGYGLQAPL